MDSDLEFRCAGPEHADRLTSLAVRSKAWWGYTDEFMQACEDELRVRPRDTCEYVYLASGEDIAGFYGLEYVDNEHFELEALFVEPGHIGSGYGRVLVDHAIENARNKGGTRITIQGDPNARGFYLNCGASLVGERESGSIPGRYLPVFEIRIE